MLRYRGTTSFGPASSAWSWSCSSSRSGCSPSGWSWATSMRYQALFSEAGGLAVGNDVTLSGIKVGTVSDISLQNGDALVTFTINGSYPLGSRDHRAHPHRHAARGARADPGVSGQRHAAPDDVIPTSRTSSPYSLTEAVSDLTTDTPAPTPKRSTSRWTRCRRPSTRSLRSWGPPSTACPDCPGRSTAATKACGSVQDRSDVTGDPVRTQPAGQHVDPQRQRSGGGAQRAPPSDRRACWPTPRRWRDSCPVWSPTTRRSWRRRWRG